MTRISNLSQQANKGLGIFREFCQAFLFEIFSQDPVNISVAPAGALAHEGEAAFWRGCCDYAERIAQRLAQRAELLTFALLGRGATHTLQHGTLNRQRSLNQPISV